MVGTSRETVTRAIKQLKTPGWLAQEGKRYVIPAEETDHADALHPTRGAASWPVSRAHRPRTLSGEAGAQTCRYAPVRPLRGSRFLRHGAMALCRLPIFLGSA